MMVVRINLVTREQTVLKQEPHPRDVTPDQFAYLLAKYAMARRKMKGDETKCQNAQAQSS